MIIDHGQYFICDKCNVVSSFNEKAWNKDGELICFRCSPEEDIYEVCDYLKQFIPIESRFDILDL